eukprot:3159257-Amphidinium_carterae.1
MHPVCSKYILAIAAKQLQVDKPAELSPSFTKESCSGYEIVVEVIEATHDFGVLCFAFASYGKSGGSVVLARYDSDLFGLSRFRRFEFGVRGCLGRGNCKISFSSYSYLPHNAKSTKKLVPNPCADAACSTAGAVSVLGHVSTRAIAHPTTLDACSWVQDLHQELHHK